MAEGGPPAKKPRLTEQWFGKRLRAMDDVKMSEDVIQHVAQEFSQYNEQNLRKTTLQDWTVLLPTEVGDEERKKVALHLMIGIREEFQQTTPAILLQHNTFSLVFFLVLLVGFPDTLVDWVTYLIEGSVLWF